MTLRNDLREFIALLNENAVEYLIVGAHAMAHHGVPRYTGDLDVLIRATQENVERVIAALRMFGFESLGLTPSDFLEDDSVVQLGRQPCRIDILNAISGVGFDEAWTGHAGRFARRVHRKGRTHSE